MITNIYKMTDAEFSVWLENFALIMSSFAASLNITPAQATEMTTLQSEHETALNEKQSADDVKQAKTVALRDKRKDAMKKVAFYIKIFKANDAIAVGLLEQLGLNSNDAVSTSSSPQQPTELVVEGFSNGINQLKWKKNGNRAGTFYIIEARKETETQFSYTGSTTKTKFAHKNQKPGDRIFYRVKAQRHDEESTYSNEAVVY